VLRVVEADTSVTG